MRTPVLAVAVVLALAGCSASAATTPAATTAPKTTTAAPVATPTTPPPAAPAGDNLAAAAVKIGCTGYAQSATTAPNADKWGTCTIDGKKVQVYQITGDAAYTAFLDSVKAYGVTAAWLVRSGDIVVSPSDQTQLPAIKAALG